MISSYLSSSGELEAGQAREPEERVEERPALRQRDAHRPVPAQVGEPGERAAVVDPRHALSREDQAPREEQPDRGQLDPLGAPAERSGDDVVPGLRIGAHVERRSESGAVVPAEGNDVRLGGGRAQPRAPGSAEERHQVAVEVRWDEVAMAHGAVARVAVEPQAIRIAGAAEQGQDLAVRRLRERGELRAPEAEPAELGEAAALARIAREHLEDERALGNRRRGVDHVEDLSPRRPVGRGVLPRGVHRMPQGSQVLLPRQGPGAGPERAGEWQSGLGIAVPVVLRVDVDPVALALDGIASVVGTGPIAVEAQEVREAVSSSHARRSRDIVESYPIAATATIGRAGTVRVGARVRAGAPHAPEPQAERRHRDRREQHVLRPAGEAPQALDPVAEAVADRVARADGDGHVDDGAQEIGDEEAQRAEAGAARERASHEAKSRHEAADEDREHPVALDQPLHALDAFGTDLEDARQHDPAIPPPDPVREIVSEHRARDGGQEHGQRLEPSLPDQVARHREDRLLGNGEAHVAEDHDDEDRGVAPLGDERCQVRHRAAPRIAQGPAAVGPRLSTSRGPTTPQEAQKGPDARRRPKAARRGVVV